MPNRSPWDFERAAEAVAPAPQTAAPGEPSLGELRERRSRYQASAEQASRNGLDATASMWRGRADAMQQEIIRRMSAPLSGRPVTTYIFDDIGPYNPNAATGKTFKNFTEAAMTGDLTKGKSIDELSEAARKAAYLQKKKNFKLKVSRQLNCGNGRAWRFRGCDANDLREFKMQYALKGKIKAWALAWMNRQIGEFTTYPMGLNAYFAQIADANSFTTGQRHYLGSEFGWSSTRITGDEYEWSGRTYTVYSTYGRPELLVSRKTAEADRAAGHFIDDGLRRIVRVTRDEWEKWPRHTATRIAGYKQFVPQAEVLETPWQPISTVTSPVMKKKFLTDNINSCIARYHNAANNGSYAYLGSEAAAGEYTFGCEIEIIPGQGHHREAAAAEILEELGSKLDVERDGSVESGFEIVTGFGTFEALDELVRELYAKFLTSRINVYRSSSSTGLHFHVGRRDGIAMNAVKEMYILESLFPKLTDMLTGREGNNYCRRLRTYTASYGVSDYLTAFGMRDLVRRAEPVQYDRYSSFNATAFGGDNTGRRFEWRSCKSTTSYASWRCRIEFLRLMLAWADDKIIREDKLPTVDDFLTRVMDAPRDSTVGIRRTLKSAAAGRLLTAMGATVPVAYNGRSEYAAVNI